MNPVYFGTSAEPLFGVYHPSRSKGPAQLGAVLCAPWGQEYMRTHRALRQLATQLNRAGVHVFRFDYFGTGDSIGASDAGTPLRWVEDIRSAADELKDTAGIDKLSFVGLRLGATLAAAAAEGRDDVQRLVLWDPVLDGAEYVKELLSHADEGATETVAGVHGFPVTGALRKELQSFRLSAFLKQGGPETLVVVSEEKPEYSALVRDVSAGGAPVTLKHIASAGNWEDMDRLGAALLPQQIIRGIVGWLSGEEQVA
jgi:pimeloyl-ACP methyl ester carboxylesterase